MVTVRIPGPLRPQTAGRAELPAAPGTVREVLDEVVARHPGLGERLRAPDGHLHRFVNVFVEEEDVRDGRGLDTPVADGEVVTIVPAVAGGAERVTARSLTTGGWATVRPAHALHWPNDRVRAQ